MKGNNSDISCQYTANGAILRTGIRARYYFFRRLGAFAMLSSYAAGSSSQGIKGNTVANNYTTCIKGTALEMGLCFRVLK
jgi:hypothetical protein